MFNELKAVLDGKSLPYKIFLVTAASGIWAFVLYKVFSHLVK
jgi:hypothetical protein